MSELVSNQSMSSTPIIGSLAWSQQGST